MPEQKTIYLFRHGEVEDRFKKRFRGTLDCDLSDHGKTMSQKNADFLSGESIDLIITTGLRRSDAVGNLLSAKGIPHEINRGFREAEFGKWEGKNWEEVNKEYPEEVRLYKEDPLSLRFPGGEAVQDIQTRVLSAWKEILTRTFKKIAIVGHSTTNTLLLSQLKGVKFRELGLQIIGSFHEIQHSANGLVIARENVIVY